MQNFRNHVKILKIMNKAPVSKFLNKTLSNQKNIVLLNFFATWCKPCEKVNKILKNIKPLYEKKINFLDINVDTESNKEIIKQFSIKGFPALLLIKDEKIIASKIGGKIDKITISTFLDKHIQKN